METTAVSWLAVAEGDADQATLAAEDSDDDEATDTIGETTSAPVRPAPDQLPEVDRERYVVGEHVAHVASQQGAAAVLLGPLSGTPYKLYAAQAAAAGIGPLAFLAISVPARLLRFVVVTVGVHALWRVAVHAGAGERGADRLLLAAWVIFYATFFAIMPG